MSAVDSCDTAKFEKQMPRKAAIMKECLNFICYWPVFEIDTDKEETTLVGLSSDEKPIFANCFVNLV